MFVFPLDVFVPALSEGMCMVMWSGGKTVNLGARNAGSGLFSFLRFHFPSCLVFVASIQSRSSLWPMYFLLRIYTVGLILVGVP